VNPILTSVRLAQRIPVRIGSITSGGVALVAGMTAIVQVDARAPLPAR
jgi:multidrug resistance efflux pump